MLFDFYTSILDLLLSLKLHAARCWDSRVGLRLLEVELRSKDRLDRNKERIGYYIETRIERRMGLNEG